MRRREAIKQLVSKIESQLNDTKTAGEKVSVRQHGRPAVWVFSMSEYATQQQVDYGSIALEKPVYGNIVNAVTMLTEGLSA